MTHIRKAALVCNRCGAPQKIDPTVDDPFSNSLAHRESAWAGWLKVDAGHHLCPPCAEEHSRRKAEMGAGPKRPAGIEAASFDLWGRRPRRGAKLHRHTFRNKAARTGGFFHARRRARRGRAARHARGTEPARAARR